MELCRPAVVQKAGSFIHLAHMGLAMCKKLWNLVPVVSKYFGMSISETTGRLFSIRSHVELSRPATSCIFYLPTCVCPWANWCAEAKLLQFLTYGPTNTLSIFWSMVWGGLSFSERPVYFFPKSSRNHYPCRVPWMNKVFFLFLLGNVWYHVHCNHYGKQITVTQ